MTNKALNPMDASWLYVESKDTPMHVGGLMIFELPKGAPLSYFQDLFKDSREHQRFYPPWNRKLRSSRLKNLRHEWVEEKEVDLDYHVRLSALPWPGGERELGILIARLHSRPLNFRRPPWECHVIQGLEHNRFALYIKIHHALIDGVSGMRMLARTLAKTPEDNELPAFWSVPPEPRPPTPPLAAAADAVGGIIGGLKQKFSSVPELGRALRELGRAARSKTDPMGVPFKAPKSLLNGRISGQRRFATQLYSMERVKKLAKAADSSLNDVVLALCSAALRRFLEEAGELPAQPLTAGIPVSVRPADDQEQGNAISFIIASLATDIADPIERLHAIRASTRRAKAHLQS
ncbi:MAG TPA: wax ester/triacylglycerol synthase family O-acyltransferase, partial [Solimonas sp.]|nr:wax ester/triacylglycerol synthase family O-acyltransferase [Solimonas sp.]